MGGELLSILSGLELLILLLTWGEESVKLVSVILIPLARKAYWALVTTRACSPGYIVTPEATAGYSGDCLTKIHSAYVVH